MRNSFLLSASFSEPVDDLYNELMSKEQRVLDTIKTVSENQRRTLPDDLFSKSLSSLWVDVVLHSVRLIHYVYIGDFQLALNVLLDPLALMHIGIAISVVALAGLVLSSL